MVKQNKNNYGAYVSPVITGSAVQQSAFLCASKEVSPQTVVDNEGFDTGGDYLMF